MGAVSNAAKKIHSKPEPQPPTPAKGKAIMTAATSSNVIAPNGGAPLAKTRPQEVLDLPLAKIHADFKWNSRRIEDVQRIVYEKADKNPSYDPEHDSTGLGAAGVEGVEPGLVEGIESDGQNTPVEVCTNTDPKTKDAKPFFLVSGFRRFAAISKIAELGKTVGGRTDWDPKAPTIRAIDLGHLSESERRRRNGSENTFRSGMTAPDVAFLIKEMIDAAKAEGKSLSYTDIGKKIGKHMSYVGQLAKIMTLPHKITHHWRHGGKITLDGEEYASTAPADVTEMRRLANVPEEVGLDKAHAEVEKAYAAIISPSDEEEDTTNESPEAKALRGAKKRAAAVGEMLAHVCVFGLFKREAIKSAELMTEIIADPDAPLVTFKRPESRPPTDGQRAKLGAEAFKSFSETYETLVNGDTETVGEGGVDATADQKGGKGAKGAKGKGGK